MDKIKDSFSPANTPVPSDVIIDNLNPKPEQSFSETQPQLVSETATKFPLPRNKNQKKLSFGLILLFAVIISGGYFLLQNKKIETTKEKLIQKNLPSKSDSITEWKTFKNEELGITFKYPSDWPDAQVNQQSTRTEINIGNVMYIIAGRYYNQDLQREMTYRELIDETKKHAIIISDITIDPYKGKLFRYPPKQDKNIDEVLLALSDDSIDVIIISFSYPSENPNESKVFKQILSTFKFIKN